MRPRSDRRQVTFTAKIARKGANHESLADRVARQPELLPEVLDGLGVNKPQIKYGCSKVLRILSQKQPAILYPRFVFFVGLLDCDNSFLKWDAVRIVANLAAVDSEKKVEPMLGRYLQPIGGPVMITAATIIGSAARVALAKPELASRIVRALLEVERAEYQTAECRNVAIGHAVESIGLFFDVLDTKEKAAVVEFARRQLANRRNAVKKKAAVFLKRCGLEPSSRAA